MVASVSAARSTRTPDRSVGGCSSAGGSPRASAAGRACPSAADTLVVPSGRRTTLTVSPVTSAFSTWMSLPLRAQQRAGATRHVQVLQLRERQLLALGGAHRDVLHVDAHVREQLAWRCRQSPPAARAAGESVAAGRARCSRKASSRHSTMATATTSTRRMPPEHIGPAPLLLSLHCERPPPATRPSAAGTAGGPVGAGT